MATVIRKKNASLWARISSAVKTLKGAELQVGWFKTARYENGVPIAYVATIHEFGSPKQNIPPRPFMRPTIEREQAKWAEFIGIEARKIMQGRQTAANLLDILGGTVSGEIARSISEVMSPALKPATIAARKRKMANSGLTGSLDKPLVETGQLFDTVTYTVSG